MYLNWRLFLRFGLHCSLMFSFFLFDEFLCCFTWSLSACVTDSVYWMFLLQCRFLEWKATVQMSSVVPSLNF